MRSPRPATTSLPPTRTAAFIAFLHGVALAEILAATARAARPADTSRGPRGDYRRGPCGRQSLCGPGGCDTRGLLHGSRAALSHAEMGRWEFAAHRRRPQRAEGGAVDERTGSGRLGREERRGERTRGTRPTRARRDARRKNARVAADRNAAKRGAVKVREGRGRPERGERRGGGTRRLRPRGARGRDDRAGRERNGREARRGATRWRDARRAVARSAGAEIHQG